MLKIKSICIITDHFPTHKSPKYTFVYELVKEFAKSGIKCTVLSPQSMLHILKHGTQLRKKLLIEEVNQNNFIKIISPKFLISSGKKWGILDFDKITFYLFKKRCFNYIKKHHKEFDVFYGHFICPSGIIAAQVGEKYNKPSFLAYGENGPYTLDCFGYEKTTALLKSLTGVIAVSTENKCFLVKNNIVENDKISVFPNGVNTKTFYPKNKIQMRKKHNMPLNKFIVAFVGGFIQIKGANRLSAALDKLNNAEIQAFYIGRGDVKPFGENIIFAESKPHNIIPELLSCADIFVLPTTNEGCCNAIIEAMACGLPIISSNAAFNDDILDETCSIRVDSTNIAAIAEAINELYTDNAKRAQLSKGALLKASNLDLSKRAKNILKYMEDMYGKK